MSDPSATATAPQVPSAQHAAAQADALRGVITRNPAWVQLLGLCPLLAVSNSVVNALGLAAASTLVMLGANTSISLIRGFIPSHLRLPLFMLVIATFTTCAVMLLEAYAFELYLRIALFVQIIVTNCMILGRIERFAQRQPPHLAALDALCTSAGFALALLALGGTREILGSGSIGANLHQLFGDWGSVEGLRLFAPEYALSLAQLPPGAFIVAGLMLGAGNAIWQRQTAQ